MTKIPRTLLLSAAASLLLILPFVTLEAVNTSGFRQFVFPAALYSFMWLLLFAFIVILSQVLGGLGSYASGYKRTAGLILGFVFMIVIAVAWGGLVSDQMPCFMGSPNCD